MPFHLSGDQELVQKTVRELVDPIRGKTAEEIDRERRFPMTEIAQLAGLGLTGLLVPPDKGGPGTDTGTFVVALEEVARASGTLGLVLNNLNALGSYPLAMYAQESVRDTYLPGVLAGQDFLAWALTEPHAGSDTSATGTRAIPDTGDAATATTFELRGVKSFVVGAPHAKAFLVFARVANTEGITGFVVPADTAGLRVTPAEQTMTMRGSAMAQVFLRGVHVPATHMLGRLGEGQAIIDACHHLAGLGAAAISVGLMQAAFEDAVAYAGEREQFRMAIKNFQAIQFLVAQLELELRGSRLLTYAAADRRDRGESWTHDMAAAKLAAGEAAKHVTQKSLRIHGGTGFMRDLPIERYNRDARALSIYAGTAEMNKAMIAAKTLSL